MDRTDFIKICKDRRFWKWIRNNSPLFYSFESDFDKNIFLNDLYQKVSNRQYYPTPPIEYLTINKGHGVLRVVPVLSLEDLCIYYYCVRKLEMFIALNRVSGTFGGFGLSGKLRQLEEQEVKAVDNNYEVITLGKNKYVFTDMYDYPTLTSLNPKAWFTEWTDFTKKLYFNCQENNSGFVAQLDISNFYDSIQLDHLEYKLHEYVPSSCNEVIYLLTHFLKFWNRHVNFYRQQGAGIPQDFFGECSRVLANFYLQSYDKAISKFCSNKQAKFFRYADDQVIFANSKSDLEEIIVQASSLLMKEGLNFNQKKVEIMSMSVFKKYYAFENFLALAQDDKSTPIDTAILESQIEYYLNNRRDLKKSGLSLLRRLLGLLVGAQYSLYNFEDFKSHILNELLPGNFNLNVTDLSRIKSILSSSQQDRMMDILNANIESCWYSAYLYDIRKLYIISNVGDLNKVDQRISFLKSFYALTI